MSARIDDLLASYRSGQISEAAWQRHLAEEPGLRDAAQPYAQLRSVLLSVGSRIVELDQANRRRVNELLEANNRYLERARRYERAARLAELFQGEPLTSDAITLNPALVLKIIEALLEPEPVVPL